MELSSYRDFKLCSSEMLMFLILRIHETSNPDVSMALSFLGLFPSPRIYAMHPLKMDGPRRFTISQLATPKFLST
jgi:hypothetical protein